MTKPTKNQLQSLAELKRLGGAVITSHWTNGTGRRTTKRAVPPFCDELSRWAYDRLPKRIRRIFDKHPRCQYVICITDMRAANRALRESA
jgi:hypothetical protein